MRNVTVIDYGIGNILSVMRAFEYCGADVLLSDDPSDILKADFLVLPGVGAFADGMEGLRSRNLIEPITQYSSQGKPFLGICLGMQMMLEESDEFGVYKGLGLIKGRVEGIENTALDGTPHKIPHIGWNELEIPLGKMPAWWNGTILDGIGAKESVYFVHSFTARPTNEDDRLADTYYGGRRISAAIRKGNLYGCQFHPEKSGPIGISILKNFLELK